MIKIKVVDEDIVKDLYSTIIAQQHLLNKLDTALEDWLVTYAPEFAGEQAHNESLKRFERNGGTLNYIGELRVKIHNYQDMVKKYDTLYKKQEKQDDS